MDSLQKKPDFAQPPVDEVVLSVLFESLDKFLAPHLGQIWNEFRQDGFVNIREQPPVPPAVETTFPNPIQGPRLRIDNHPDLARTWFIHADDSKIIQVQRDRFMFNWRKTELAPTYPGFSTIFDEFEEFYNRFKQIIEEQRIGEINPLQYELTYIDQLFHGSGWYSLDDIGKIYNFIDAQQSDSFWAGAESMILRTSFPAEDLFGRLHLTISSRVKMPEERKTLQTDFTMRGFPDTSEYDAMIAWFKAARDQISKKFSSMFTENIQTRVWGRKS